MPTLNWIGKEAVVNHHRQVPFHLLKDVPDLACGKPGDGNLIVQGDNLVALKALLPYYAGQVKCIYIDPPYNTGNEGWVYNDNVNSPVIREWLGRTVGKEGETREHVTQSPFLGACRGVGIYLLYNGILGGNVLTRAVLTPPSTGRRSFTALAVCSDATGCRRSGSSSGRHPTRLKYHEADPRFSRTRPLLQ